MEKSYNSITCMLIASFTIIMGVGSLFFAYTLYGESQSESLGSYLGTVLLWAFTTTVVGFIVAAAYGIPIYRLFNKFNFSNYYSLAIAGGVPGTVLYLYSQSPLNAASIAFGVLIAVMFNWLKNNNYGS